MRLCSGPKSFCWQVRLEWNLLQMKESVDFQCGCFSEVLTTRKEKEYVTRREEMVFVVSCLRMCHSKIIKKRSLIKRLLGIYSVPGAAFHMLGKKRWGIYTSKKCCQSSCGALKNKKLHYLFEQDELWEFNIMKYENVTSSFFEEVGLGNGRLTVLFLSAEFYPQEREESPCVFQRFKLYRNWQ